MIDWPTYREKKLRVVNEYDDTYDKAGWDEIDAACEKNVPAALYEKGIRIFLGEGVEKDEKAALFWFDKLLERQKHTPAMCRTGEFWEAHGTDIQEQKKCLPYYAYGSELGNGECSRKLGVIYNEGILISNNVDQAFRYYRLALRQGENYAKVSLGLLYLDQNDFEKAFQLFRSATQDDYGWAYYWVGKLYFQGWGVEESNEKALPYYLKAFEKGIDEAKPFLGFLYGLSDLPEKDPEKALLYLDDVPDHLKGLAYRWKGAILYSLKRRDEALYWLEQAVGEGDTWSKDYIKKIKEEESKPTPEDVYKAAEQYIKNADLRNAYKTVLQGIELYPDNLDVKCAYAEVLDILGQIFMSDDKGKPDFQARMEKCREAWNILKELQARHYKPPSYKDFVFDDFIAEVAWHYGTAAAGCGKSEIALEMMRYANLNKHPSGYLYIAIKHGLDTDKYSSCIPDDIRNLRQAVEKENWDNNALRADGYHYLCETYLEGAAAVVDIPYAYYCIQRAVQLNPENEKTRNLQNRFFEDSSGNISFHY